MLFGGLNSDGTKF